MKQTIILATVCLLLSDIAYAGEQYLCTADRASGFWFNKSSKEWEHTTFKANSKYVISKPDDGSSAFVVREIGRDFPNAWCKDTFNEAGFLLCEGIGGDFKFNRKNGRFISAHLLGYFNVVPGVNEITDTTSDTPYLEIGKCSPF